MPGLALPPGLAAPGTGAAAKASGGEDSADGLMELLSAAEELRRCTQHAVAGSLCGKQRTACSRMVGKGVKVV